MTDDSSIIFEVKLNIYSLNWFMFRNTVQESFDVLKYKCSTYLYKDNLIGYWRAMSQWDSR